MKCNQEDCEYYDQLMTDNCAKGEPPNVEGCTKSQPSAASTDYDNQRIKSELIRIAAVLVQCHYIPSNLKDDYSQKTYSAGRVAQMMKKAHKKSKNLAIQVRYLADLIKT